jgi:hypothetical protein
MRFFLQVAAAGYMSIFSLFTYGISLELQLLSPLIS